MAVASNWLKTRTLVVDPAAVLVLEVPRALVPDLVPGLAPAVAHDPARAPGNQFWLTYLNMVRPTNYCQSSTISNINFK